MSEYSSLLATINANVKANNNHEITGAIMNSVLNAMVNSLGAGYQYMGVATPTNPGSAQTPDYKCFYLATTPGTYTNLGGLVVADGEVAILKYDSSWTKEVTGIASADKLNQLDLKEGAWGLNIFDEVFEVGDIGGNGQPVPGSTTLRTRNFTPCLSDWDYSISMDKAYIYYYKEDGTFISLADLQNTPIFHTPNNAGLFKLVLYSNYGTTYNNDVKICQKFNWIPELNNLREFTERSIEYCENNIFDGVVEQGDIDSYGKNQTGSNLRTANYTPIFPNTKYLFKLGTQDLCYPFYYDENYAILSIGNAVYNGDTFTSPNNAKFIRFAFAGSYGTTYNNDLFLYQEQGVGKNILDLNEKIKISVPVSEWEIGDIDVHGQPVAGSTTLRTKEFIQIPKFEEIFVTCKGNGRSSQSLGIIYYYNAQKEFISYASTYQSSIIPVPKNALYFKFVLSTSYGTTYNDDVDFVCKTSISNVLYGLMGSYNDLVLSGAIHTCNPEWEIGDIGGNGQPVSGSTTLRTKEFLRCSRISSLFVSAPLQQIGYIYLYDSVKAFIELKTLVVGENSLPSNAKYFKVVLSSQYGTTYNNDVFMISIYRAGLVDYIVAKDGSGDFLSLTDAVNAAVDGDIIFVKNGEYDNEAVRAWGKTITIIGQDKYKTIIKGAGDYLSPPFEMASGVLKNLTAYAYGETPSPNGRYAYAIHADNQILSFNSFIVENCILKTKMGQGAVGMGLRGGCHVLFKDCDFICETEAAFFMNETVTAPNWGQTPGDQYFEFNNCKFISENPNISPTARFEGYHSRQGFVYATFINNVFVHKDRTPMAYFYQPGEAYYDPECENIEGNIVIDSQGNKLINWFITKESFGNTIPALNYRVEGTINGL